MVRQGVGAVRWKMGLLSVLGLGCVVGGVVCGVLAIVQEVNASAYSHAVACSGAPAFDADCIQTVSGTVTAISEIGGKNSHYELDVQVGSRALAITFPSGNSMLGYAADGDPADVTVWRGIPVAVTTDGRSATPSSLPEYAAAADLGHCMEGLGLSSFFLQAVVLSRRQRRTGTLALGPFGVACLMTTLLGGAAVAVIGMMLGKDPSDPGAFLIATAVALVISMAVGTWFGAASRRNLRKNPGLRALRQSTSVPARERQTVSSLRAHPRFAPRTRPTVPLGTSLRYRLRPSVWLPSLWAQLKSCAAPALVVVVLFGLGFMASDAPNAQAFRDAPACQGETNLSVCVGDFTATVNGVRTASQNAGSASISYVTGDGAINAWGSFSGSGEALAGTAQSEETSHTSVQIEVWRGAIVGAEIAGSWHWADGNPPGDRGPAILLVLGLMLLLLLVRFRAHRLASAIAAAGGMIRRRAVLLNDVGQVAASASGYVLLLYGYWYGALLIAAELGWMAWTARRNSRIL